MSNYTTMDMMLRRLLKYRRGLGLSQTDFAKSIGSSQTNYSEIERGINIMSYRVLNGLYQCNCDFDYFFTGTYTVVKNNILENLLKACSESKAERLYALIISAVLELWKEEERTHWKRCLFSELRAVQFMFMQGGNDKQRLHYLRVFYELSQKDLGNIMGVGRTKCAECEYGKKYLDADMVLRLYNNGYALPSFFFEEFAGLKAISVLLESDEERRRRFYHYLETVLLHIMKDEKLVEILRGSGVL